MSVTAQDTKPYARCNTCGIDLPTQDDQRKHMDETMETTGELGISAQSHSTSVVNPTPAEVEDRRLRRLVESPMEHALTEFCEEMDDEVRRGRITEEQVTEQLRHFQDFADAWSDWLSDND